MKTIAASIPSLEAAAAFKPDVTEVYEMQEKQLEESIEDATARNVLAARKTPLEATAWPALPEGAGSSGACPEKLRIDVGWHLWKEDGEGTDLQYQVLRTLHSVARDAFLRSMPLRKSLDVFSEACWFLPCPRPDCGWN
jgi:hypothetical protein